MYRLSEAEQVLRRYAEFAATMPDELGISVGMTSSQEGQPMLLFLPLWNGDKHRGERLLRDLQALGTPQLAEVGPMTYSDMLALYDPWMDATAGCHWEMRTRSLPALIPDANDAITRAVAGRTSPYSMVNWHHLHGAATRIPAKATAFGLRQEHFMLEIIAGWDPKASKGAAHRQWAHDLWESLAPFALPGGYANQLAPHDREQARDAYGSNGARLRALKRRFDPDGVFASAIPLPDETDVPAPSQTGQRRSQSKPLALRNSQPEMASGYPNNRRRFAVHPDYDGFDQSDRLKGECYEYRRKNSLGHRRQPRRR